MGLFQDIIAWFKSLWVAPPEEEEARVLEEPEIGQEPEERVEEEIKATETIEPVIPPIEPLPPPPPEAEIPAKPEPPTISEPKPTTTLKPEPTGYTKSTRGRYKYYIRTKDGGTYTALCETACGGGTRSGTCGKVMREGDTLIKRELLRKITCYIKVS